uniref:Uncharacterized protein n=1 Tax=Sphaerodactylus townsendi TaxID=933632 RepID=A0ACB8FPC0_9SAUR
MWTEKERRCILQQYSWRFICVGYQGQPFPAPYAPRKPASFREVSDHLANGVLEAIAIAEGVLQSLAPATVSVMQEGTLGAFFALAASIACGEPVRQGFAPKDLVLGILVDLRGPSEWLPGLIGVHLAAISALFENQALGITDHSRCRLKLEEQ